MPRFLRWVPAMAAVPLLWGCSGAQSGAGCQSNADCHPGDVCNHGQCYAPVVRPTTGGAASSGGAGNTAGGIGSSGGEGSSTGGNSIGGGSTTGGFGTTSGSSTGSSTSGPSSSGTTTSGTTAGGSTSSGGSSTGSASSSSGGGSSSSGGGSSSGGSAGGAVTCSAPATNYLQNGGGCGTERWAVKTGTDNDVASIDMVPQVTTIAQLVNLPVAQGGTCTRGAGTELTVFELQDVNLMFHGLESDSDYHVVATDNSGNSMIVEIPYPACVGNAGCISSTPLLCEITHARAAVDGFKPSSNDTPMGVGSVVGVGFFDFKHGQTGVAPNAIELHPVLGICLGQGCDPLAGY